MANASAAPMEVGHHAAEGGLMAMLMSPAMRVPLGNASQQIMRAIEAKNYAAAIAGLQKALSVRKKNPAILRWLVVVAHDADNLLLARKYARKLVQTEPGFGANHVIHGTVLDRLGLLDEAVAAFLKADRLQPGVPKTLISIGRAYSTNGDHDQAVEYFEKALTLEPDNDLALHNIAQARRFQKEDADVFLPRVEGALSRTADALKKARLHFAAGKVFDDVKDHDAAFARFEAANDLLTPSQPRNMSLMFKNTRFAFPNRKFFEDRPGFGLETDRPIFIVGMPRSGTTLMESLCAAHPDVTAGDEQTALPSLATHLGRDAVENIYARMTGLMSRDHSRAFAQAYLEHCEQTVGTDTRRFTDKMPHNFINVGLIALLFPNAKIIHCRRHPLDSALSLYSKQMGIDFHQQYKAKLSWLGEHYRGYLESMEHWRMVLPGRMLEVMYEDVVINTEINARAILDFLGLEWDDGVLDRSTSQRRVATASQWQVRQPIYQSAKGRWLPYEKHLGPLIEAIGPKWLTSYDAELAALDRATAA